MLTYTDFSQDSHAFCSTRYYIKEKNATELNIVTCRGIHKTLRYLIFFFNIFAHTHYVYSGVYILFLFKLSKKAIQIS